MTIWDKIYRGYLAGGEEYATLKKGLIPDFLEFIEKHDFKIKKALDLGCGNGKYLVFLKSLGFETDGIDSSPTAVEMAKKALGGSGRIWQADMYSDFVPSGPYDLILSIAAIHHGMKIQVARAIESIHNSLIDGGYFFVTLPDNEGSSHWTSMVNHQEIEPGTRVPFTGPEAGLPHSSFTGVEIKELFKDFRDVETKLLSDRGRWIISGRK